MNDYYEFNTKSIFLIRNAEIALKVANGAKIKDLAKEYKLSNTTIINAYKNICRRIFFRIRRSESFNQDYINNLYDNEFKCKEGIKHLENHLKFAINYKKENFLDSEEIEKSKLDFFKEEINEVLEKIKKLSNILESTNKEIKKIEKTLDELFFN